jgi:hypothetical protein
MSDLEYEPHNGQHRECDPCFKIKLQNIQFQGIDAGQHRFTDKERDKDMASYKALRMQGYQPAHVYGSAEIAAQAGSAFEIRQNVVMAPSIRKEMESSRAAVKEILAGQST